MQQNFVHSAAFFLFCFDVLAQIGRPLFAENALENEFSSTKFPRLNPAICDHNRSKGLNILNYITQKAKSRNQSPLITQRLLNKPSLPAINL